MKRVRPQRVSSPIGNKGPFGLVITPNSCLGPLIPRDIDRSLTMRVEACARGQVLHGSARTAEAVRRAIQHSRASLRVPAKRRGIHQKTVAKKKRPSTADLRTGPGDPHSTAPTARRRIR